MKKIIVIVLSLLAFRVMAGTTNFVVAIPTAGGGGSSVIWSAASWTNTTSYPLPYWTNNVTGPINFVKIRLANVDAHYGYNISDAGSQTPVVQANTIDNINLQAPGVNITNICARENGSTGNGTAEVWMSWQEPSQNAGFPR